MTISENYARIQERIAAARATSGRPHAVTLLAVSKTMPEEKIEELYRLGHRDFGENYVQELVAKAQALAARGLTGIRWHFIGHLQTNKVKQLIPHVHAVHSVDSLKLAQELSKRWVASERQGGRQGSLPVFVEVNIDAEAEKAGVAPESAPVLAAQVAALPGLELRGLMCIPAPTADSPALRGRFAELRALEARCRPATRGDLSMGMSGDFELAIWEGATHIRVGTAIFGERAAPRAR